MNQTSADVLAECEEIHAFVATLEPGEWQRRTAFYEWTVYDEVLHMHFLDLLGLMSLQDTAAFLQIVQKVNAESALPGYSFRAYTDEFMGLVAPADLMQRWRATYVRMCEVFAAADERARMKWFGPDMSIRSFATARQMEVWAHGQDIYDLYGVRRAATARLRNIALLGVRTYGWSFANRRLPVPEPEPYVRLGGPAGDTWEWNDPGSPYQVAGSAEDFCLVVTQRRHVDDTGLRTQGAAAAQWMQIAQCFAGPPANGPRPGERKSPAALAGTEPRSRLSPVAPHAGAALSAAALSAAASGGSGGDPRVLP